MRFILALVLLATPAMAETVNGLKTVDEFAGIEDDGARSIAIFEEMLKVIEHPRCLNCHPAGDSPLQGDDMVKHMPPVVRGVADFGAPGMYCTTCHGSENVAYTVGEGSIPGHTPWQLAPIEMAWVGKSASEICEQIKDPERNGDMDMAELHEHMAEDGLVGWGWNPGAGRTPVPGTQEILGELTQSWIDTGAMCPGA